LRGRGTETEESLAKRLAVAKSALQYGGFSLCSEFFGFEYFYLY